MRASISALVRRTLPPAAAASPESSSSGLPDDLLEDFVVGAFPAVFDEPAAGRSLMIYSLVLIVTLWTLVSGMVCLTFAPPFRTSIVTLLSSLASTVH